MYKIVYFIFLLLLSCNNIKVEKILKNETESNPPKKQINKKIGDYMSDEKDFIWTVKHPDTTGYLCEVLFQKEFVVYIYNGQCIYWYFTNYYKTFDDKIELLWSYKSDCLRSSEFDFLEKSNGIKKFPKRGDSFCEYILVNDTVIKAKYNFPEWTKKVNQITKDSIFPVYLYLKSKNN